jgi:hypothetical protein
MTQDLSGAPASGPASSVPKDSKDKGGTVDAPETFVELVAALEGRGGWFGDRTFCPFCEGEDSNSPSLWITERDDGGFGWFCFSAKSPECNAHRLPAEFARLILDTPAPRSAIGLVRKRGYGTNPATVQGAVRVGEYHYGHAVKEKWILPPSMDNAKTFWWRGNAPDMLWPTGTIPSPACWIAEGEKDVDRLRSLGFDAFTTSKGRFTPELAESFRDRTVHVLFDADQAGVSKRDAAVAVLRAVGASVRVIGLGYPIGERGGRDVSNWLDEGHTPEELRALTESTEAFIALAKQTAIYVEETRGAVRTWAFDHELSSVRLDRLGKAGLDGPKHIARDFIIDGQILGLCGEEGTGKTWLGYQLAGELTYPEGTGNGLVLGTFEVEEPGPEGVPLCSRR